MSQYLFLIGPVGENALAPRTSSLVLAGFPSGQRDQTVNLTAMPSKVRILLPPPLRGAVVVLGKRAIMVTVKREQWRVWYNGRTSAFQADDAGSIPATRSTSSR